MPVTRDVALDAVSDLLARPPRASVTFADADGVIAPARARFVGEQPFVGLPAARSSSWWPSGPPSTRFASW